MLAAGDLTKQLSESFTPDNAIRFSPWSIWQQLNGFHSKESTFLLWACSLSSFFYSISANNIAVWHLPLSDVKKIGGWSGVPGVGWSGLKLQVNMSKWRNFSEISFSLEMRVKNDVAEHQPNLPQLITLTCSSFMTMVFDCCFCCRSSQQIHYLRLMQQVKHPLLTSLTSFPICRFLHLCPMLSAMGSFWKR